MERSIIIENGGTRTDISVWDGTEFTVTKTLTTPFDLSQRLFDGVTKASAETYGRPASSELLHSTSTSAGSCSPRTACGRVGSGRACSIPSFIRRWSDSCTTPRIGCTATGSRTLC